MHFSQDEVAATRHDMAWTASVLKWCRVQNLHLITLGNDLAFLLVYEALNCNLVSLKNSLCLYSNKWKAKSFYNFCHSPLTSPYFTLTTSDDPTLLIFKIQSCFLFKKTLGLHHALNCSKTINIKRYLPSFLHLSHAHNVGANDTNTTPIFLSLKYTPHWNCATALYNFF